MTGRTQTRGTYQNSVFTTEKVLPKGKEKQWEEAKKAMWGGEYPTPVKLLCDIWNNRHEFPVAA